MEASGKMTALAAIRLAAPHTWAASLGPALFGILYCALAELPLRPAAALAALCACVLMQSSVNAINDYFDCVKGVDSEDDYVEASDSVLISGHIRPRGALLLGLAYLSAALLLGLWLALESGFALVAIGAVGAAAVLLYSGGPLPLSYLPVGELVSGVVMGALIPLGIAAASDGVCHWELLPQTLPFILSIALIMMSNNGSDIEKDVAAKRRTLPVILGRRKTCLLFRAAVILWTLLLCLLPCLRLGWPGLLCPLLLALLAAKPLTSLMRTTLLPENRVRQMKTVLAANITANGAYLCAMAAGVLVKAV